MSLRSALWDRDTQVVMKRKLRVDLGGESVAQNQLDKVRKSRPKKTPGRTRFQPVSCTAIQNISNL